VRGVANLNPTWLATAVMAKPSAQPPAILNVAKVVEVGKKKKCRPDGRKMPLNRNQNGEKTRKHWSEITGEKLF
jgi:hypothetical protein